MLLLILIKRTVFPETYATTKTFSFKGVTGLSAILLRLKMLCNPHFYSIRCRSLKHRGLAMLRLSRFKPCPLGPWALPGENSPPPLPYLLPSCYLSLSSYMYNLWTSSLQLDSWHRHPSPSPFPLNGWGICMRHLSHWGVKKKEGA